MPNPIVLFDLGGVLVDLGEPALDMALPMSEEQFWSVWLRSEAVARYETGGIDLNTFCAQMSLEFGLSPGEFTAARLERWRLPLFPRVNDVLPALAETATLALLSNTNATHWQGVNRRSDVFQGFDHVFLSYEVGLHKPDPRFFEHALTALAARPEDVLFVDDSARNVAVARELGIDAHQTVGFDDACGVLNRRLKR